LKRFWLGLVILLILAAVCLVYVRWIQAIYDPVCALLQDAARQSLDGQWDAAWELAQQAQSQWQQNWHLSAAAADHSPMDDIDSLFAQLSILAQTKNRSHFAAVCAQLAARIQATADAHGLTWWNLL